MSASELLRAWERWDDDPNDERTATGALRPHESSRSNAMQDACQAFAAEHGVRWLDLRIALAAGRGRGLDRPTALSEALRAALKGET